MEGLYEMVSKSNGPKRGIASHKLFAFYSVIIVIVIVIVILSQPRN
jgi:hypothetical protein